MSDERDETQPYGTQPFRTHPYGSQPSGTHSYGGPPYSPTGYGQTGYAQTGYAQPYGAQARPQQYGQYPTQPYGPQYGPPYGPHGGGPWAYLARPGSVVTAAVLAFVYGACGLLTCVLLLAGGAFFGDLVAAVQETDPSVGDIGSDEVAAARAGLLGMGLVALAWTVVMVWGGALALRGRSRVLLLVGAAIAVAVTGSLALFGVLGVAAGPEEGQAGGIVFFLVVFLGTVAMLVLLCLRSAARFFAAHRAVRRA